jgi:adenylate kinase family enzyme
MNMPQKSFIFIGISGCGKGTQIGLLENYLYSLNKENKILNIQSGGLFRDFIKGDSYTQRLSKNIYDAGGIQPSFLAIHVWSHELIKRVTPESHIIIDGSPRTYREAVVMDTVFKFYKLEKPNVVFIDINREEAMKRLLARKRFDDNVDDINERLNFYYSDVVPAIDNYKTNSDYNFIHINGIDTIDNVHKEIIKRSGLLN